MCASRTFLASTGTPPTAPAAAAPFATPPASTPARGPAPNPPGPRLENAPRRPVQRTCPSHTQSVQTIVGSPSSLTGFANTCADAQSPTSPRALVPSCWCYQVPFPRCSALVLLSIDPHVHQGHGQRGRGTSPTAPAAAAPSAAPLARAPARGPHCRPPRSGPRTAPRRH
jgi:hypothetical protein